MEDSTFQLMAVLTGCVLLALIALLAWRYRRSRPAVSRARPQRRHIFICYQVNTSPDQEIARGLYDALKDEHEVFIEDRIRPGVPQFGTIKEELGRTHWFVVLLSERSVKSSLFAMILGDAQELLFQGRLGIIPVRVRYRGPLPRTRLGARYDDLQPRYALWESPDDTPRLIDELREAVAAALPPPQALVEHAPTPVASLQAAPQRLAEPIALYAPPEVDTAANAAERLRQTYSQLQEEHRVRTERLGRLRVERALETDVSRRFQIDEQIRRDQNQLDLLLAEIEQIEHQIQRSTARKPARVPELFVGPMPSEAVFEPPEGAMNPESRFYIPRKTDRVALSRISQHDVTIVIKGPRQVGKSSLLKRMIKVAEQSQKQVVFLDFQTFDDSDLSDAERFFQRFFALLSDRLGLPQRVHEFWARGLGNRSCGTSYMEYLLSNTPQPIVLAMDEVDRLLPIPFRTDFFGMLRSWHNQRAASDSIWRRLDLVMIISTDPNLLIAKATESPFNVAESIRLLDFSLDEVKDLNYRYGRPLTDQILGRLNKLLNGHPYLVRKALYSVCCNFTSVDELFKHAANDQSVFADHLRTHLYRLAGDQQLTAGLIEVIDKNTCSDHDVLFRLRGAGLVREEDNKVLPRCKLYADYFKAHLLA